MDASALSLNFPKHGRYQYLSHQQAGMGVVVFAIDAESQNQVVLKTIKPELLLNQSNKLGFLQEAVNWLYLGSHPNLVQAYAVVLYAQPVLPWVVLEGIKGASFGDDVSLAGILQQLPKRQLPIKSAVKIVLDVAHGLQHACERIPGLVHRDIKPENILLGRDGTAKVTDFGIATTVEQSNALQAQLAGLDQQTKDFIVYPAGSPGYIPAEMFVEPGRTANLSADVYALGMVLYEILTGHKRVQGSTHKDLRDAQMARCFLAIPAATPDRLRVFLERCANANPDKRHLSWADFITELQEVYRTIAGEYYVAKEFIESQSQNDLSESYLSVAQTYLDLEEWNTALAYSEHVVARSDDMLIRSRAQLVKVQVLFKQSKHEQAVETAESLLRDAPDETAVKVAMLLAHHFGDVSDHQQAKTLLNQARVRAGESDNVLIDSNLALLMAKQGEFDEALSAFSAQLNHYTEVNDWSGMCHCLHSMGLINAQQHQWESALVNFDAAINQAERLFDSAQVVLLCKYAIEACIHSQQLARAKAYVDKIRAMPGVDVDDETKRLMERVAV